MKKLLVSMVIVLLAVSLTAAQSAGTKQDRRDAKKVIKLNPLDFSGSARGSVDTFTGNLTGEPTYDKYSLDSDLVDLTCMPATSLWDEGLTEYIAIPVEVTAAANLAVSFSATGITDTWLGVYCDFDPANPDMGMMFYNDDGSVGLISEILDTDGVTLQPGAVYWVVVSVYSDTDLGDGSFTLELSTAGGSFTPVEVQSFSVD
jgi:hypothetical protein